MERTPSKAKFVSQLSEVNDQLCFAAFSRHEFQSEFEAKVNTNPSLFTTDVFSQNPYAKRIHRQMNAMLDFAVRSEQIELQMSAIAGYEFAVAYFAEVEDMGACLNSSTGYLSVDDAVEERLFSNITEWRGIKPEKGPYQTLGYLRLLRNHYAHLNDKPSPAFRSYISNYAHQLQRYWDNGITNIGDLEFKRLPFEPLTPEIAFGLVNLLRVAIERIDADFAQCLSFEDVVDSLIALAFDRSAHHNRSLERLSRVVQSDGRLMFGEKFALSKIIKQTESFLERRRMGPETP